MLVSALLANKGTTVFTIESNATVAQAVSELRRNDVGALVVSADGKHIDGIVSERDVVRKLDETGGAIVDQPVRSIMSTVVKTCSPQDDTETLMSVMTNLRIRHIPVVDKSQLCGIISIGDVVKGKIDELQKDRDQLVDYIQAR